MDGEKYLALIRGINVGGKNIIKMTDLKACFEDIGFANVMTYIQSGNVLFHSKETNKSDLRNLIEKKLSEKYNSSLRVVLLTVNQLEMIVREAPADFGSDPGSYRYDVLFLMDNLSSGELLKTLRIREGVDFVSAGRFSLYFSRLISRAVQSYIRYIISMPEYQHMTIRNWNTTIKLLDLMKTTQG